MKQTAGAWEPDGEYRYFLASGEGDFKTAVAQYDYWLLAMNELRESSVDFIREWCRRGKHIFIDSGVFNLMAAHSRKHDVPLNVAIGLAPEEIDGFDELFARYTRVLKTLGPHVWGYVEIDQGGRDNKLKTRARLESMGFSPIPVYHPFNDGWDYFDQLAETYDRICVGNLVAADPSTRKRLVATMWERRRKYPHLWVHLLGVTPGPALAAFPSNSCDSSAWLAAVRWPQGVRARVALKPYSPMDSNFAYQLGSDSSSEVGHTKARLMGAYDAAMTARMWRSVLAGYRDAGFNVAS